MLGSYRKGDKSMSNPKIYIRISMCTYFLSNFQTQESDGDWHYYSDIFFYMRFHLFALSAVLLLSFCITKWTNMRISFTQSVYLFILDCFIRNSNQIRRNNRNIPKKTLTRITVRVIIWKEIEGKCN